MRVFQRFTNDFQRAVWQLQPEVAQILCVITYQPDTKFNPIPHHNPTTKHHAMVNIQLNIVTCPT